MHIEVVNFTGYEDCCTINYFDYKGDYIKTYILENLKLELFTNKLGINKAFIKSCACTYVDDQFKMGFKKVPSKHEIKQIENALTECIDWDEWQHIKNSDVDDFMYND